MDIAAGTYNEAVSITEDLTVAGAGASATTIEAPAGLSGDVVAIGSGVTATLSGFTIACNSVATTAIDVSGTAAINDVAVEGYVDGIEIEGTGSATITGSTITGCTNFDGSAITLNSGTATIGGTAAGAGNTISGDYDGMDVFGDSATIIDNTITDNIDFGVYVGAGTATLTGNAFTDNAVLGGTIGLYVDGGTATVGGTAAGAGNTFSDNAIGLGVIHGSATFAGNTITDNSNIGLFASFSTATITGNTITGNGNEGVLIIDSTATIGGMAAGAGNLIAGNATGVSVSDGGTAAISNDAVTGNATGILVGSGATDTSVVTAQDDDLSGNTTAGITNDQTGAAYAVSATGDWWGSRTGPATPAIRMPAQRSPAGVNFLFIRMSGGA